MGQTGPDLSVVIPVFNEAENLGELHARLVATLEKSGRSYEIVFVDDGSSDGSLDMLRGFRDQDSRVRIVRLSRNFGQSPALFAGFAHVRGRIVATLDADLQNPPEELPKLVEKLEEGYDMVNGVRVNRHDSLFRRLCSKLLNYIIGRVTKVPIHDHGCSLKAFRREVVDRLSLYTHRSRYLPVEVALLGVHVAEVDVGHSGRVQGDSKYSLLDLVRLNFDIITSITSAPLQLIGLVGWFFALIGFAMAGFVLYIRIAQGDINKLGSVTALFFIIAGVHMITMGLMCEYVGRIFIEVQNKPYYIVKEVIEEDNTK